MLKFSLKHMAIRSGKNILIALSIIITLTVSLLSYNISNQVKDGIIGSYKYYDTIIGAAGSQTQLVLNTLFYTDKPVGLIAYEVYEELSEDSRVVTAIPFAEGDNYNNARIIGTNAEFLDEFTVSQGRAFEKDYEAVIGCNVAKNKGLAIGATFFSVHGLTSDVNSHQHSGENEEYTVVGILAKTNTAADNVIFTGIDSVWETHGIGHDHDDHDDDDDDDDDHDHDERTVTAILIKCASFNAQNSLCADYNRAAGMQAVNPSAVMRELLDNVDMTKNIVYLLCGIILAMNLFIISVITMLNMYDIKKDIILLRLIGISKGRIEAIVYIQCLFISVISALCGFALSRIAMPIIGSIAADMGIVLNTMKIYSLEFAIVCAVIVMVFLPMIIAIKRVFKGRLIDEK